MKNTHPKIQEQLRNDIAEQANSDKIIFKKLQSLSAIKNEELYVILKAGKIYKNTFFESAGEARNFIKMQNSTRSFKDVGESKLICKRYGTTFEIEVIYPKKQ